MPWTKRHSRNAVAAKARLRLARASLPEPDQETAPRASVPRPPAPDFTITIRARSGDRVQFGVWRIGRNLLTRDGCTSARAIGRGIEVLLREAVA